MHTKTAKSLVSPTECAVRSLLNEGNTIKKDLKNCFIRRSVANTLFYNEMFKSLSPLKTVDFHSICYKMLFLAMSCIADDVQS